MDGTRAVVLYDLGYFLSGSEIYTTTQQRILDTLNLSQLSQITLPQRSGNPVNCYFRMFRSIATQSELIFLQPQPSTLLRTCVCGSRFPFSISAIVMPIFNFSDSINRREEYVYFQTKYLMSAIQLMSGVFRLPIIILCLNDESAEPFADFSDDEWWILPKYRAKLKDDPSESDYMLELKNNLYLLEHNIGDIDFPTTFFELLHHISKPKVAQSSRIRLEAGAFVIPHLENVIIQHDHIGTGKTAAYGFVMDCLKGLSGKSHGFRIWIDAVESAEPAYHLYVEYEGLAHDGLMAFQRPMNTVEYQSSLNSTWRTYIDITPEMTLDEAKEKLNDIIQRIKDGVLEEE